MTLTENEVKVYGSTLRISAKQAREIAHFIRGKPVKKSKTYLRKVIQLEKPIPFKRYYREIPHRKGPFASGRFPVKASKEILNLLNTLEANAEFKGLDKEKLIITKILTNKGPKMWHPGRKRRRRMKSTHVEIYAAQEK